jgi:hypothetical protein
VAAPGGLVELGEHMTEWERRVREVIGRLDPAPPRQLVTATPANADALRIPDWPAVPARVRACLGRSWAHPACDLTDPETGDIGRREFQEEYAEWRIVRDGEGRPVRFELTTELGDYWELLAGYAPDRALELVGQFADRDAVDPEDIFGRTPAADPEGRRRQFRATMLGDDETAPGLYNNGRMAITCLSRGDNTLAALINLAAASVRPMLVHNSASGELRFPSGSEAITRLPPGAAQDCRFSDPVVVERIVRLATEGRLIRFDDPIGIYILDVQHHELLTPAHEPVPAEWFKRWRGADAEGTDDSLARHQRIEFEVPSAEGFQLSDLRSRRTGQRIRWGAEIAELIQLGVYVRVSGKDATRVEPALLAPMVFEPCSERSPCTTVRERAARLERAAAQ